MAVTTETSSVSHAGTGSQTAFAVPFRFLQTSDLTVKRTVDGLSTNYVENIDYSVSQAADKNSGTVTFSAAPVSGLALTIERTVPLTQLVSFRDQGSFSPSAHEDALDSAAFAAQQIQRKITELESIIVTPSGPTLADYDALTAAIAAIARKTSGLMFNVRDYGALGDGNSHPMSNYYASYAAAQAAYPWLDEVVGSVYWSGLEIDWVASQAAINAACDTGVGGIVYFPTPTGFYKMNAGLSWGASYGPGGSGNTDKHHDGVYLVGASRGVILKWDAGYAGAAITVDAPADCLRRDCGIQGLTLNVQNTRAKAVWAKRFYEIFVDDCKLIGPYSNESLGAAWSSGTTYAAGDIASSGGRNYRSLVGNNLNQSLTDGNYWTIEGNFGVFLDHGTTSGDWAGSPRITRCGIYGFKYGIGGSYGNADRSVTAGLVSGNFIVGTNDPYSIGVRTGGDVWSVTDNTDFELWGIGIMADGDTLVAGNRFEDCGVDVHIVDSSYSQVSLGKNGGLSKIRWPSSGIGLLWSTRFGDKLGARICGALDHVNNGLTTHGPSRDLYNYNLSSSPVAQETYRTDATTTLQAAWSSGTTYANGAQASYAGRNYTSLRASNTNHVPTDSAWWQPGDAEHNLFGEATHFSEYNFRAMTGVKIGTAAQAAALGTQPVEIYVDDAKALRIDATGLQFYGHKITWGAKASPPAAGTWAVGDRQYHSDPVAGGTEGYVCTASGTFAGAWAATFQNRGDFVTNAGNVYQCVLGGVTSIAPTGTSSYIAMGGDAARYKYISTAGSPTFKLFGSIAA